MGVEVGVEAGVEVDVGVGELEGEGSLEEIKYPAPIKTVTSKIITVIAAKNTTDLLIFLIKTNFLSYLPFSIEIFLIS